MAELLCHLGILKDYNWINVGDRLYSWVWDSLRLCKKDPFFFLG